ncbi:MAG: class I SAM-dependent methyltransferase [Rhodothermia bacterium]
MSIDPLNDNAIVDSWVKNALPWTTAVREGLIESRRLCTDQAIVDAVLRCAPQSVIDLGCGEGWLTRKLVDCGLQVIGLDVVPEMIEEARRAGKGDFRVLSYEEIEAGKLDLTVDVVVCNFSLLGKESVERVVRAASRLLNPQGALIVQTLHPLAECGEDAYQDGWREGTWAGISSDFADAAPWYFRTLESWVNLFVRSGFQLRELQEPLHPGTGKPASVIFIALL